MWMDSSAKALIVLKVGGYEMHFSNVPCLCPRSLLRWLSNQITSLSKPLSYRPEQRGLGVRFKSQVPRHWTRMALAHEREKDAA